MGAFPGAGPSESPCKYFGQEPFQVVQLTYDDQAVGRTQQVPPHDGQNRNIVTRLQLQVPQIPTLPETGKGVAPQNLSI